MFGSESSKHRKPLGISFTDKITTVVFFIKTKTLWQEYSVFGNSLQIVGCCLMFLGVGIIQILKLQDVSVCRSQQHCLLNLTGLNVSDIQLLEIFLQITAYTVIAPSTVTIAFH